MGEIWDEHDEVINSKQGGRRLPDLLLPPIDRPLDLFQDRECDSNTISGWVMERIGRVPEEGVRFVRRPGRDGDQVDHRRCWRSVEVLPERDGQQK